MSENEKKKKTDKEIIAELKKEKQLLAKQTRANLFLGVAVGILCIVSAYSFGLSSGGIPANLAGIKSSDEPMGDIIQALAALVGVLVAGYGIFVANDSSGKAQQIIALQRSNKNRCKEIYAYVTLENALAKKYAKTEKLIQKTKTWHRKCAMDYAKEERIPKGQTSFWADERTMWAGINREQ